MIIRRRTHDERKRVTRAKFIAATIRIINRKGFAALRVRDITEAAAVTWGAAQNLFGSRDALLMEVATSVSESLIEKLETNATPDVPWEEKLSHVIEATWEVYTSEAYFAMVEIVRGTRKVPRIHNKLVKAHASITRKIEALWVRIFSDTHASKEQILHTCDLVVLFLGGAAARKNYFLPSADTRKQIEMITAIARRELAGGKTK